MSDDFTPAGVTVYYVRWQLVPRRGTVHYDKFGEPTGEVPRSEIPDDEWVTKERVFLDRDKAVALADSADGSALIIRDVSVWSLTGAFAERL